MDFAAGITGSNAFVIPEAAALILANIAMGQSNQDVSPVVLSTISQTMTQSFAAAAANMSARFGKMVRFNEARAESAHGNTALTLPSGGNLVRLSYQFRIEGQEPVPMVQVISVASAREIVKIASGLGGDMNFGNMGASQSMGFAGGVPMTNMAPQNSSQIGVSPVQYPQLQQGFGAAPIPHNISVLMDVQMQLSVELGRTRKKISEILSFGEGSILELDKLAGEPVDVLVNGKLIAKGEVVVIDENFGVRVTEIVSPSNRIEYST
jgi:flagellar motor switch protein FliN/FliY